MEGHFGLIHTPSSHVCLWAIRRGTPKTICVEGFFGQHIVETTKELENDGNMKDYALEVFKSRLENMLELVRNFR